MEQTQEMMQMQQELNAIKIRCFDAETVRDRAMQEAQSYNTILTSIADKLGVIVEDNGARNFSPTDIESRLSELLSIEELHTTPALPLAE